MNRVGRGVGRCGVDDKAGVGFGTGHGSGEIADEDGTDEEIFAVEVFQASFGKFLGRSVKHVNIFPWSDE